MVGMENAGGRNDVLHLSETNQPQQSSSGSYASGRPTLSNRQVGPRRTSLAASNALMPSRPPNQDTTIVAVDDSSDDDESSLSYSSTFTAPTRSSSRSSFPTTIATSEKLQLFDEEEEYDAEGNVQYLYYPPTDSPVSSASSSSSTPSTPPAVLLVPPRMAQYNDYPEHFSYPTLSSLASSHQPGGPRLNTPPPLYTHTCRTRAESDHDASWQPIIPPHQQQPRPRYPQQMRQRPKSTSIIEQPLTLEQELRRMMDRELAAVLQQRGVPARAGHPHHAASSLSASSSAMSSSSSLVMPSPTRSRQRSNRTSVSSTSSLPPSASAAASSPAFSLARRVSSSPIIPSPLRRSSSGRSSRSTRSSKSTASTIKTRAVAVHSSPASDAKTGAISLVARAPPVPNPNAIANATAKRHSSIIPLAKLGRWLRPRNNTK